MANPLIKPVKKAIAEAFGYRNVSVKNGTGTAWGWVDININHLHAKDCKCEGYQHGQSCKDIINNVADFAKRIAKEAIRKSNQEAYTFYSDGPEMTEIDCINTQVHLG